MKKVLVTGSGGLLGSKIVEKAAKHVVFPTHAKRPFFPKSLKMNITDENEVKRVFGEVEPDIVVHTAAETNVDKCETNKEYALKVNARGTKVLAEACSRVNSRIVYVSTDYVFDGEKGLYAEEDAPNPVNYYGLTKLMGEKYVATLCEDFVILRTSVLYGIHSKKPNFAKWVIEALKEKKTLTIVEDHYNSPTFADNLADVILEIIGKRLLGVYHIAGSERISRYEFALKIAKAFNLDYGLVKPIKMDELTAWVAKRPKDSSLCVDKIQKEVDVRLLDVTQSLREMNRNWAKTK